MAQIINSTQGGAKIKGTEQWALIDALTEFTDEKIDKSVTASLLSYATDGDELVKKVIPLLIQDVKTIKSVIKHSKAGLKSNKQMRKKGITQDRLNKLLSDNYKDSTAACMQSRKIPLINVAIFGVSREINSRELAKRGGDFKKITKKEDLDINLKRNKIILQAAIDVAKKLLKGYQNALKLLREYDRTKNDKLLRPVYKDSLSIKNIENDFENGNFARPLLIIRRLLEKEELDLPEYRIDSNLSVLKLKTLKMRNEMIEKAKKAESKEENDDIRYKDLLEYAQKVGKEYEDWEKVEYILKKAIQIKPNGEMGLWALASLCEKQSRLKESSEIYKKLINSFPGAGEATYLMEFGQIQLTLGEVQSGIDNITKAMSLTDRYDGFAKHLGNLYFDNGLFDKSVAAYDLYLGSNENDYDVLMKKGMVLTAMDRHDEADKCFDTAEELRPKK